MVNPGMLLKLQKSKDRFVENHPKFPAFLKAVGKDSVTEGTVIELQVTKPNGESMKTNIKLQPSDVEMFTDLLSMVNNK